MFDKCNEEKKLYYLKKIVLGHFAYLCKSDKLTPDEKVLRWEGLEQSLLDIVTTANKRKKARADQLQKIWHEPLKK